MERKSIHEREQDRTQVAEEPLSTSLQQNVELDPAAYDRRLGALFSALGENINMSPEKSDEIKEELLSLIRQL